MQYNTKIEYHIDKIKEAVGEDKFQEIKVDILGLLEYPNSRFHCRLLWSDREK